VERQVKILCCAVQDDVLLAHQIGFDLFENEMQSFSKQVRLHWTHLLHASAMLCN